MAEEPKGPGREPKSSAATREVRLGAELVTRLQSEAEARGLSTSFFATKLVSEALARLKPVEDFTLLREPDDD